MRKYLVIFTLSFFILIIHAIYTNHAIYGDGNAYYVYSQSIYYEGKINSRAILDHLSNFPGRDYVFSRVFWDSDKNPFLIGPGLIWIPSLIFMDLFSVDRFDLVHEIGPGLTGIVLMLSGLYYLEKYLRTAFDKKVSNMVVLSLFFGSNIFYYSSFEPALSHQPAFFIISLLLCMTVKPKINFFAVGLLSGLLTIVRVADSVLLIPILFLMQIKVNNIISFLTGFFIALTPQFYVQYEFYGNALINPYLSGISGSWSPNLFHLMAYLFSPIRGLFVWSPIFLLGIIGLIKQKSYLILYTLLFCVLIHSSWSAYLSAGFGQRFAVSFVPFLAIGLAQVYKNLSNKKIKISLTMFSVWNFFLVCGFYLLNLKDAP